MNKFNTQVLIKRSLLLCSWEVLGAPLSLTYLWLWPIMCKVTETAMDIATECAHFRIPEVATFFAWNNVSLMDKTFRPPQLTM